MLRWFRRARAPTLASLLARKPPAAAIDAFGKPNVQHVRIRTRRRLRNVAIGAGVLYMCWSVYLTRVLVRPLAEQIDEAMGGGSGSGRRRTNDAAAAVDDDEHDDTEDDDDDEDDDGASVFVPLPFTFQVVESRPYKGSDPEWQAYIRIAEDQALLKKIRDDMVEIVRVTAEANPVLARRCGRPMRVREHWLNFDFPYRPPPKVLRDGLLVTGDGGLEYVTTEVDSLTMMRITRALWPVPVALAASAFATTLARQNALAVARVFGLEGALGAVLGPPAGPGPASSGAVRVPAPPGSSGGTIDTMALRRRTEKAGSEQAAGSSPRKSSSPAKTAPDPPPARPPAPPTSSTSPPDKMLSAKDLVPYDAVRASIDDAWIAFRKKLAETWRPPLPLPPGGCVGVTGLVELQAAQARVMIEVVAFWNPKTRKYDTPTMVMKLRSIRPRQQVPL